MQHDLICKVKLLAIVSMKGLNDMCNMHWKFGRFDRNYAETVPFHKISTPGNLGGITIFFAVIQKYFSGVMIFRLGGNIGVVKKLKYSFFPESQYTLIQILLHNLEI